MLLNESPSKGEPKIPLRGIWVADRWDEGRWKNPRSRSLILLWVLRDVPLKRKKSTGGLFRGADQLSGEVVLLVRVPVPDVGTVAVLGTEWIFFGLPTEKGKSRVSQYEITGLEGRMRLIL